MWLDSFLEASGHKSNLIFCLLAIMLLLLRYDPPATDSFLAIIHYLLKHFIILKISHFLHICFDDFGMIVLRHRRLDSVDNRFFKGNTILHLMVLGSYDVILRYLSPTSSLRSFLTSPIDLVTLKPSSSIM